MAARTGPCDSWMPRWSPFARCSWLRVGGVVGRGDVQQRQEALDLPCGPPDVQPIDTVDTEEVRGVILDHRPAVQQAPHPVAESFTQCREGTAQLPRCRG